MTLPKISIVTPSYNQARYIGWTVRSVLLQRYANLEYIVMDGGSTDGTMDVLAPYADRFAHLSSAPDKGQADAIARGFERSSGEIMAYLNSDDMLSPGTLHFVADYFARHPQVDALYSHRVAVDADNKVIWYWILPPHRDWWMMRWDLIPQETCFWRRSLYEKAGGIDPSYRFAMDYDLFVRFMRAGRMERLDRFLGVFREHDSAKTSTLNATVGQDECRRVWQKYGLHRGRFDALRSARYYYGVVRRGWRFAHDRRQLPGCLGGLGYNYDLLWGGLLSENRVPRVISRDDAIVHGTGRQTDPAVGEAVLEKSNC